MGRWIKIRGNERPTNNRRDERCLERYEKLVVKLQLHAFVGGHVLTEKQKTALFAYGTTLQLYGRMRYLNEQEVEIFDTLVAKDFLRTLLANGEPVEDRSELDQFIQSLPARHKLR